MASNTRVGSEATVLAPVDCIEDRLLRNQTAALLAYVEAAIIESSMEEQSASDDKRDKRARAERHYFSALESLEAGDAAAAVARFEAALTVDPELLDAMHGLIRALQESGRYDDGIAVAQELARIDPDDVLACTALSILYQRKGLIPEAEEASLKAKLLSWKQQLRAAKTAGGHA